MQIPSVTIRGERLQRSRVEERSILILIRAYGTPSARILTMDIYSSVFPMLALNIVLSQSFLAVLQFFPLRIGIFILCYIIWKASNSNFEFIRANRLRVCLVSGKKNYKQKPKTLNARIMNCAGKVKTLGTQSWITCILQYKKAISIKGPCQKFWFGSETCPEVFCFDPHYQKPAYVESYRTSVEFSYGLNIKYFSTGSVT